MLEKHLLKRCIPIVVCVRACVRAFFFFNNNTTVESYYSEEVKSFLGVMLKSIELMFDEQFKSFIHV